MRWRRPSPWLDHWLRPGPEISSGSHNVWRASSFADLMIKSIAAKFDIDVVLLCKCLYLWLFSVLLEKLDVLATKCFACIQCRKNQLLSKSSLFRSYVVNTCHLFPPHCGFVWKLVGPKFQCIIIIFISFSPFKHAIWGYPPLWIVFLVISTTTPCLPEALEDDFVDFLPETCRQLFGPWFLRVFGAGDDWGFSANCEEPLING
jgi:hypothetical protein